MTVPEPRNWWVWLTVVVSLAALSISTLTTVQFTLWKAGQGEDRGEVEVAPIAPQQDAPAEEDVPLSAAAPQARIRAPQVRAPAEGASLQQEATFWAERLLAGFPESHVAMHVRAILHAQLHQTADAERLWKRCIELSPKTEVYYVNLAATATERGASQLALDTLERAQERGLNSLDIQHHIAVSLMNLGQIERAIEVARGALESTDESPALWLVLGQALLKDGQIKASEEALLKAVELGATTKPAYFALLNASVRLGKMEEAAKYRDLCAQFEQDQHLSAQARYNALSDVEGRNIVVTVLLEASSVYRGASDSRNAAHLLQRVLALDPGNLTASNQLADLFQAEQRFADELILREHIVRLNPLDLFQYLRLAKAASAAQKPEAAEAAIQQAISLAPRAVNGYVTMAEFLLEQGRPEDAEWYGRQATTLVPSPEGFQLLAKILRVQGRESEAQAVESQTHP